MEANTLGKAIQRFEFVSATSKNTLWYPTVSVPVRRLSKDLHPQNNLDPPSKSSYWNGRRGGSSTCRRASIPRTSSSRCTATSSIAVRFGSNQERKPNRGIVRESPQPLCGFHARRHGPTSSHGRAVVQFRILPEHGEPQRGVKSKHASSVLSAWRYRTITTPTRTRRQSVSCRHGAAATGTVAATSTGSVDAGESKQHARKRARKSCTEPRRTIFIPWTWFWRVSAIGERLLLAMSGIH